MKSGLFWLVGSLLTVTGTNILFSYTSPGDFSSLPEGWESCVCLCTHSLCRETQQEGSSDFCFFPYIPEGVTDCVTAPWQLGSKDKWSPLTYLGCSQKEEASPSALLFPNLLPYPPFPSSMHPTGRPAPFLFEGTLHVSAVRFKPQANTGRHYYSSQYFSRELHRTLISVSYRKSCDLLQNTWAWCHKGYWGLVIWNNHKALCPARPPRGRASTNCSSFAKCWRHTTCQLVCLFRMRTLTLIRKKTQ